MVIQFLNLESVLSFETYIKIKPSEIEKLLHPRRVLIRTVALSYNLIIIDQ
jgi:hypothetical protein